MISTGYDIWSLYWSETVQEAADEFSIYRKLEFLDSPKTKVAVLEPIDAEGGVLELRLSGRCADKLANFSIFLAADLLKEEEKKQILRAILRSLPSKLTDSMRKKRMAAQALGLPKFLG